MWICSTLGFFSIVQKGPGPGWQVRARVRHDLENLVHEAGLEKVSVIFTPAGDYAWRIAISQRDLGQVFATFQRSIRYPNFKSAVAQHRDQADKLHAYHQVWGLMATFQ